MTLCTHATTSSKGRKRGREDSGNFSSIEFELESALLAKEEQLQLKEGQSGGYVFSDLFSIGGVAPKRVGWFNTDFSRGYKIFARALGVPSHKCMIGSNHLAVLVFQENVTIL